MEIESRWPGDVAQKVTDSIRTEVEAMVRTSRLARRKSCIALVERQDIQIGRLLGSGSFSEVHEVQLGGGQRVAIKFLKRALLSQPDNFRLAARELAVEAHMLSSFDHPNIIKIRGWVASGVQSYAQGRNDSFFLLLDCLDETLDQRLERWEKQSMNINKAVCRPLQHEMIDLWRRLNPGNDRPTTPLERMTSEIRTFHIKHQEELYLEKLRICGEIASALAYLHENGVIYRDLKPSNLGFRNNRVNLFDFGLSRELPHLDTHQPFQMSGKVGTLRYMAVEVACLQPYNVAADVYSWAMVSYEIMTHTKPFAGWTRDMHSQMVCGQGARPSFTNQGVFVPPQFSALIHQAWNQMPHLRPSIQLARHNVQLLEHQQLQLVLELMKSNQFLHMHKMPDDTRTRRQAPSRNSSSCTDSTVLSNESWE